jgi:uncharacterized membrane protein YdjX (TVP38/TMEM64 family)
VIGPAAILAVIVGLFHVSAYVFIRGRAGARLPLLIVAAVLGAWAGDAVGGRIAIDPVRIGDFHLLLASVVAWLAIGLVAILSLLVPERSKDDRQPRIQTQVVRGVPVATAAPAAEQPPSEQEQGATT